MTEKEIKICGHGSGNPSLKNMYTYLENRYNLFASNGVRKGLVAVRRCKGLTEAQQKLFVNAYSKILGRNIYSQNWRTYVFTPLNGRYYSDCSSSGDACFKAAGHDVGWLNTAGQYTSSLFETVPAVIKNGHIQNPEILHVGDALLFAGNDPSRPKQIGHVEYVYQMPSKESWHWLEVDGFWYYQNQDGVNKHGWECIKETYGDKKHWYFFNEKGQMLTGMHWINEELCLFQPNGLLKGAMCKSDDKGYQHVWNVE